MANTKYVYSFVDPPMSDCYCPMCSEILKEPMLTNCCGLHYCKQCIEPLTKTNKPCPNSDCGETEYLCIVDKPKWRKILELDVICPHKGRGCNWKGDIGSFDKHLDSSNGTCLYIDVPCPNNCGEEMEKYELAEHKEKFCSKRPFTCEYCGLENTFVVVTTEHVDKCPAYPIECEYGCGDSNVTRSSYEQHLEKCPEAVIDCEFSYAGCEKRIPRRAMSQHLSEDVLTHLSFQTAYLTQQLSEREAKLNKQWEKKFEQLTTEIEKIRLENKSLKIEGAKAENNLLEIRASLKMDLCMNLAGGRKLSLKIGDIVEEDVDIVVNPAHGDLRHVSGVSRALNEASNGELQLYTNQYIRGRLDQPIGTTPFLTSGGKSLKCKQVMHAFGPQWSFRESKSVTLKLLSQCVAGVLKCAEDDGATSIAMPAMNAKRVGGNLKDIAEVIVHTIRGYIITKQLPVLSDIRIVIYYSNMYDDFAQCFLS